MPLDSPPFDKVTLRDIARKLGLCHTTVSRALHGNKKISETRRRQIQEMARKMGYHPNLMATALGQQRRARKSTISAELAWINYWEDPHELRSFKEFDLYWQGAYQTAEQYGYRLENFACHDHFTVARLEKILLARNIQGILIPPHPQRWLPPGWNQIHWEKFCVVRFGYSVPQPAAHVVTGNHVTSGLLAFENIRRRGYRRVGFVSSQLVTARFRAGFLTKQMDMNPKERIPILLFPFRADGYSEDMGSLSDWLKKHRPDAILTDIGVMRQTLDQLGYRVPQDIGLAALSVMDGNADAGIYQNSETIGRAAVETLLGMINRNDYGIPANAKELLIEPRWMDGTSLPDRNSIPVFNARDFVSQQGRTADPPK